MAGRQPEERQQSRCSKGIITLYGKGYPLLSVIPCLIFRHTNFGRVLGFFTLLAFCSHLKPRNKACPLIWAEYLYFRPWSQLIRIIINCIAGKWGNFDKRTPETTSAEFPYDYDSIMHYGPYFFR